MKSKTIEEHIKIFKNIPILILKGKQLYFANPKAKKVLHFDKINFSKLSALILKSYSKRKNIFELIINQKKYIYFFQIEVLHIQHQKYTLCILKDVTTYYHKYHNHLTTLNLYKKVLDDLPIGIVIHELGNIKYLNKEGQRIVESKSKKEYLNYNIINFLTTEKDKQRAIKRIQSKDTFLKPEIFEIINFKKHRKIVELSSYLFPHIENNEDKYLRLIVFQDKTDELIKQQLEVENQIKIHENKILKQQNALKQKLLDELTTKREQLLNTINYSDYLFWITDAQLNILLFNHAFYDYCLKYYNIKIKVGDNTIQLQDLLNENEPHTKEIRKQTIQNILNTKKEYTYEIKHYDKELKKDRIYKITFKPFFGKNKVLKNFYCYGHEITEKYDFINQIQQQAIKLNAIIQNSPIYLWSMNKNQELVLFNSNYEKIIEKLYGEKPIIGKKLSKGKYAENKELINLLNYHYQKAFNGSSENFKLEFKLNASKTIILDVNLTPIVINNKVEEVSGIAIDITEELEKQKQLQHLLYENEILMKEIHHRIKNNLQVISSMINMQIQNETNEQIKNVLRDTQNRVYSMATIHQTLYQNRNYSSINISNNILLLTQNIIYSFNITDIEIQTDIEDVILDVNTAVPLCLIINEALTNTFKYAFPPSHIQKKILNIQLKITPPHIVLVIKDNGIGISKEQLEHISHAGFSIIKALAEQINAKLFISSMPYQGTEIKLIIPQL